MHDDQYQNEKTLQWCGLHMVLNIAKDAASAADAEKKTIQL